MHPITTKISTEIDVLYGLCKLAEDYLIQEEADTKKKRKVDKDLMEKRKSVRKRILERADSVSKSATRLYKIFDETVDIPINDKLLISEKQNMMDEVLLKLQNEKDKLLRELYKRIMRIRKMHNTIKGSKSENPHRYAP